MESIKSNAQGMVSPGLFIVHCEGKVYLGKWDGGSEDGLISLRDTIELLFSRKVSAQNEVTATSLPAFPFPMEEPTLLFVRPAVLIPVDRHEKLIALYNSMTGKSPLFLPR